MFCSDSDKKMRYWQKNVGGGAVKEYYYGKEVECADAIYGVIYGQHFLFIKLGCHITS